MDSFLITLVVIVIAALSSWLQQRAQGQHEPLPKPGADKPRTPQPRRRVPPTTIPPPVERETPLERELRRLLGGEVLSPPVPHPPRSPQQPAQPRPLAERGPEKPLPPEVPPQIMVEMASGRESQRPPPARKAEIRVGPSAEPTREASVAYARAAHLHQTIAERLRHVDEQTKRLYPTHPLLRTDHSQAPASSALALVRNPRAARDAFVASLIFGTPKALE